MSEGRALSHDQFPQDICVPHVRKGENVGFATTDPQSAVLLIHRSMMQEGPCPHRKCSRAEFEAHGHYLNLINPAYLSIGIGIAQRHGTTWLTEDFIG